jgi:hypothetical protein
MSIDTSRSEQLEGHCGISSPAYLSAHGGKGQPFRKLVAYTVNLHDIATRKKTIPSSHHLILIMGSTCSFVLTLFQFFKFIHEYLNNVAYVDSVWNCFIEYSLKMHVCSFFNYTFLTYFMYIYNFASTAILYNTSIYLGML